MIYLIHGQNQVDSRRFLIRLKNNYQMIQPLSGEDLTKKTFQEILSSASHSLFAGKAAILIENFKGDWAIFPEKLPKGLDFILWSSEKVDQGKIPVKSFLFHSWEKVSSFKLTDAVLFKNQRQALILATQLLAKKEPIEKIIGALARGFFLLYAAKEESLKEASLASFAKERIIDQANLWSRPALKKALVHLLAFDLGVKEGRKTPWDLITLVGQLI